MKTGKFCDMLAALANVAADGSAERSALEQLATGLRPFARKDVDELLAAKFDAPPSSNGEPTLSTVRSIVEGVAGFANEIASAPWKSVFRTLVRLLNEHSRMSIREYLDRLAQAFVPGAPPTGEADHPVDAYVRALKKSQHDAEQFPIVYGALLNDPRLDKDDIVSIASEFAFRMAKTTTKKVALERIWKMHDASQAYVDKTKAGKSAA